MRGSRRLVVFLLAQWLAATAALGLEIGETVVVVRPTALETPRGRILTLAPGTSVVVQAMDGEHLTVAIGRTGRIARASVIPVSEALAYFSAAIAKEPRDAGALSARGLVWLDRDELDKAIADLDESLRLDSSSSAALTTRGWAWKRKGDKDRAMADFDRAIALDANNALAWRVRGATWASKKEYPKARAHYTESIRIDPENPDSLHHRALLLAACTEAQYRDGKQAVADATRACEISGWNNPLYLNGLAAASAEMGDFKAAVEWQTKAMERVPEAQKKAMQARVELYQMHQPFRMTWR